MSATQKVTVLTTNGRRQNVSVSPNTTILQILEQVCQKHNFATDEHGLKHHNKELDLSQMFRFSGLPNNCLLELFKTDKKRLEQNVELCIQLEDGQRSQGSFLPSDNLQSILLSVCPERLGPDKNPVIVYMRTELFAADFEKTTLKSLGMTGGRAMVRLMDKKPEELKTQANVYIRPVQKDVLKTTEDTVRKKTGGGGGFSLTTDLVKSLKEKSQPVSEENNEKMEVETAAEKAAPIEQPKPLPKYDWGTGGGRTIRGCDDEQQSEEVEESSEKHGEMETEENEPIFELGPRNAVLFSLESANRSDDDLPDSFYELTVSDLRLILRDLKEVATGNDDAPLLTAKMRELDENKKMLNKIAQYKDCIIRIQFPDRHVLQGIFKPIDKIGDVYEFVRGYLKDEFLDFHLFTIPLKKTPPLDQTLLEADCVPTVVLHFGTKNDTEEGSVLKEELFEKITSPAGAVKAASRFIASRSASSNKSSDQSQLEAQQRPGPSTGAIPKRPRNEPKW